jgi:hypothetical protein
MPIYEYEYLEGEGPNGENIIEIFQNIHDEALTKCPYTGNPIRRIVSVPSDRIKSDKLPSNKRLGELGFTKYERKGKGYYERTAGNEGPNTLRRPSDD